ncbi:MAG: hypothetical protein IH855_10785 [Bacteroidetes bacterium]|nr:hypothetical protein [Bacteroidota bacterium]
MFKIANTSKASERTAAYRDLLKVGQQGLEDGRQVRSQLDHLAGLAWEDQTLAEALRGELDAVLALFPRILEQCRRRVIDGESVPAEEKVVSIFEPHTDILVKGQREPQFGHKICLTGGTSNLILDCIIERGNPAPVCFGKTLRVPLSFLKIGIERGTGRVEVSEVPTDVFGSRRFRFGHR